MHARGEGWPLVCSVKRTTELEALHRDSRVLALVDFWINEQYREALAIRITEDGYRDGVNLGSTLEVIEFVGEVSLDNVPCPQRLHMVKENQDCSRC